ncbi:hypothetical protein QQ045_029081 [Rhodiola kirilowii]
MQDAFSKMHFGGDKCPMCIFQDAFNANSNSPLLTLLFGHVSHADSKMHHDLMSERYCYNLKLVWNSEVKEYLVKAYGAGHFSRISKALMYPSCYTCIRVNTLKSTSDDVIEKLEELVNERRTNLSDELVEDVRDPICKKLQSGMISKCQVDNVLFFGGSGPHSIEYSACARDGPIKEVIVSRKCIEAVLPGAQVYVPGVLACSANVEKGDKVAVSVAIEQLGPDGGWGVGITRDIVLQGSEADPQFFERKGLYIGEGTSSLSRAGMFRVNEGTDVDMHNRVFKLPSLHGVLEGDIFVQNLPSIISAHALDPQPGERIMDMCAAPRGKTTAIALLMKDRGEVVATDRSHNKVLNIQKLADEMGLIKLYQCIQIRCPKICRRDVSNDVPVLCSSDDLASSLVTSDVKSNGSEIKAENGFSESLFLCCDVMLQKWSVLRDAEEASMSNSRVKQRSVTPRKQKSVAKENASPGDSNLLLDQQCSPSVNFVSPVSGKLKISLPPRPTSSNPLKRNLVMENMVDTAVLRRSDFGVKVSILKKSPNIDVSLLENGNLGEIWSF